MTPITTSPGGVTDTVPPHNWPVALFILLLLALPGAVQWLPGASAWNSAAESSAQESALPNRPQRIAAPSAAPPVEEVKLMQIAPEKARLLNAATPFSALPNPAARPFRLAGGAANLARATDCLAAAAWYEAGDDPSGERAVVQVVLNRLRHPAFPNTVCGVVFQGSERVSGCQFTFTCDGALARVPSEAAWERARSIARAALSGTVFSAVGNATHYHTDWVVPYWSSSLDKVTAVGTHLFFRWKGWWGTPAAFRSPGAETEPRIALIARLSAAHAESLPTDPAEPPLLAGGTLERFSGTPIRPVVAGQHFGTAEVVATDADATSFILALDRNATPESYQAQALALCGGRARCRVLGWTDAARTPGGFPIYPGLLDGMAYSYMRDSSTKIERSLWNCEQFPRSNASQCMLERDPAKITAASAPAPAAARLQP